MLELGSIPGWTFAYSSVRKTPRSPRKWCQNLRVDLCLVTCSMLHCRQVQQASVTQFVHIQPVHLQVVGSWYLRNTRKILPHWGMSICLTFAAQHRISGHVQFTGEWNAARKWGLWGSSWTEILYPADSGSSFLGWAGWGSRQWTWGGLKFLLYLGRMRGLGCKWLITY